MRRAILFASAVSCLISALPAADHPPPKDAFLRAVAANGTAKDLDRFLKSLPRMDRHFIVEGDLVMTEAQVRAYVGRIRASKSKQGPPNQELIVNLRPDGLPDYYRDPRDRELTYVVHRGDFPGAEQYRQVAANFAQAAREWEALCDSCKIKFVHREELDEQPGSANVSFHVRFNPALQDGTVAVAFFPSAPPIDRNVFIAPIYFTQTKFDPVGVFRHELGHVLGYRHEQVANPGCFQEEGAWLPITKYDPYSVMHYPCAGVGNVKLIITQIDIEGHVKSYGNPSAPPAASAKPDLVIDFQGGNQGANMIRALRILKEEGVLPTFRYTIQPDDNPDKVLRQKTGLPTGGSIRSLLKVLTEDTEEECQKWESFKAGECIWVPAVTFVPQSWSVALPKDSPLSKQRKHTWGHLVLRETDISTNTTVTEYRGYRLIVEHDSADLLRKAAGKIAKAGVTNVVVTPPPGSPQDLRFHSMAAYNYLQELERDNRKPLGSEADVADFIGFTGDFPERKKDGCGAPKVSLLIIDQPVDYHPDLEPAFKNPFGGLRSLPADPDGTKYVHRVPSVPVGDHGTHLAGIVAAQPNLFGTVGLWPCVNLYSYNWPEYAKSSTGNVILRDNLKDRPAQERKVILFASQWNRTSSGADARFKSHLSAFIQQRVDLLWVVAAGDSPTEKAEDADPITAAYPGSPMNLGDQMNVLVVTACRQCDKRLRNSSDARPSLESWAYRGDSGNKMVHLAATGMPIPSTVGDANYSTAGGTSQAAAMVAGVAVAVMHKYPFLDTPEKVKYWLEVTAIPFGNPDLQRERRGIAAGILNPDLALKDPQKSYKMPPDETAPDEISNVRWCESSVTLSNDAGEPVAQIPSERIVRMAYDNNFKTWTIFSQLRRDPQRIGDPQGLDRSEPGYISDPTRKLVLVDGRPLAPNEFHDLLLARQAPVGSCK